MKNKLRIVQVYASTNNYPFNGYNNVIIRITKETDNRLYGYITNLRGGAGLDRYDRKDYDKIVINKNSVQGWRYLKEIKKEPEKNEDMIEVGGWCKIHHNPLKTDVEGNFYCNDCDILKRKKKRRLFWFGVGRND